MPSEPSKAKFAPNDVFDLLIQPALEQFDFDVIRADRMPTADNVTAEIVDAVQSADLCIFDLSGRNSNVFYECGRRHESGRPFLHIVQKGEPIPFDIAAIRSIVYDLSDPRLTREGVLALRDAVSTQQRLGFDTSSAAATLNTINERLSRIERALGELPAPIQREVAPETAFADPRRALQDAFIKGDISRVVALLPRLEQIQGHGDTLIGASAAVARAGVPEGVEILRRILTESLETLTVGNVKHCIAGLVQYYSTRDMESEGMQEVRATVDHIFGVKELTDGDKAFFLNQLQILAYGAGHYETALAGANEVTALDPDEPAYRYNRSLIFEKLGRLDEAVADVDFFMTKSPDEDHLAHAAQVYAEVGRQEDAYAVIQRLKHDDSDRATFLMKMLEDSRTKR